MKRLFQNPNYNYYAKINLTIGFRPVLASLICLSRTQRAKVWSSLLLSRIMWVKMFFLIEVSPLFRLIKYQRKLLSTSFIMWPQAMMIIQISASSSHLKRTLNTGSYLKLFRTLNSWKISTNLSIQSLINRDQI